MDGNRLLGALALVVMAVSPAAAGQPQPMAAGRWALLDTTTVPPAAEVAKICQKPPYSITVTDKTWVEQEDGGKPMPCDMPRWKKVKANTFEAPANKCRGTDEAMGDGDGSLGLVVKGPGVVEFNNSLYVLCPAQ